MSTEALRQLLCIADIHGDTKSLKSILECCQQDTDFNYDLILLAGDLTNFGTPQQALSIVELAKAYCNEVFAVAGNCDSPEIDAALIEAGVSLMGIGVRSGPLALYGVSAMPPWQGTMYELTEEEIAQTLAQGRSMINNEQTSAAHDRQSNPLAPIEIIVSHPPPRGTTVDNTHRGAHVGSQSLRDFVETHAPSIVICGHIHEARGIDTIGETTIVNCGPAFVGSYARICISASKDHEQKHSNIEMGANKHMMINATLHSATG